MDIKINYPKFKQHLSPIYNSAKNEIIETASFYSGNFRYGWERGRKLAKFQHRNSVTSFIIKAASSAAKTKIRSKDISPLMVCALFTFTNPIPGMGVAGFALGKACNKFFTKGIKALKHTVNKIKLK